MFKLSIVSCALMLLASSPQQPSSTAAPTAIPAEAARQINPVKATPVSLARARKMFGYDCAVCHGVTGNGKGELAEGMKLPLKDFTDPLVLKDRTDGEIYYIIQNGMGQMTGEGDRQKPEELWNMVLVVRAFAKVSPT